MNRVIVRAVWASDVADRFDAWRVDGFAGEVGQTRIEQGEHGILALTGAGSRQQASVTGLRRAARTIARRIARVFALTADPADEPELLVDLDSFSNARDGAARDGAARDGAARDGAVWDDAVIQDVLSEELTIGSYRFRMISETDYISRALTVPHNAGRVDGSGGAHPVAAAVNQARDLVNLPAVAKTPRGLAIRAVQLLEPRGIRCTVHDEQELKAGGFGGILAVGKGSPNPPVLLELSWGEGRPDYVFVGKGVTYDSGGLSLKSSAALMDMKSDMSGAAAVIAAFSLFPDIAPGRSLAAVIPLVENMPGPAATRPGDVAVLRDGSTLEVLDTDFEGRIILADALARAAEREPAAIIDIASLTYAAQHALGNDYAALFANDDSLAERVLAVSATCGDRAWRLPMQPGLHAQIQSPIADFKNFPGASDARTASAALLLSQFVGTVPWAHIDMVGPGFRLQADDEYAAGGTGYGVRLLAGVVRDV